MENNVYTAEEQVRNLIGSHDIYYDEPERKPSHVFFERYTHEGRRLLELVERIAGKSVTYKREDRENGIYPDGAGGYYRLSRCEFLLHKAKTVEAKLLEWYRENKYSQGDSYSVRITNRGRWEVSYSNDYPMQHGHGSSHVLTEEEFAQAMAGKASENKSK